MLEAFTGSGAYVYFSRETRMRGTRHLTKILNNLIAHYLSQRIGAGGFLTKLGESLLSGMSAPSLK